MAAKLTMRKIFFIFLILILLNISLASALELPPGLKKIEEANKQAATNYLQTITIAIAFLAGLTSIFAPCILPLLPAFFSYTFKQKTNITKMTTIFFLGFSTSFIALGIIAVAIFKSTIGVLQDNLGIAIRIIGLLLIILGIMGLLERGFSGIKIKTRNKNNALGIFFYGIVFAIGWTACLGPILSGVLLMSSVFNNYITAAYLMFFYSLGMFVPLFLLSIYFDKTKVLRKKIFNKEINIGKFRTHITNFISGILFILIGAVFLIFGKTSLINTVTISRLDEKFYSYQNILLDNSNNYKLIGITILILTIITITYFALRQKNENK